MEFRISDTFTASLTKLTGQEQKAVKTTAFDLQLNPVSPGMRFHKLDRSKDPNFWSISVNMDIRLIVHKTDDSLMLGKLIANTERHLLYVACTRARDYLIVSGVEPASEFLDDLADCTMVSNPNLTRLCLEDSSTSF